MFNNKSVKIIYRLLIPLGLLIFWFYFSLSYVIPSAEGLSILVGRYDLNQFTASATKKLLKGEKLAAKFQSKFDNLGIIAVRFDTLYRLNDDQLIFRIKQEGNPSWHYQNDYKTDQFQTNKLFPFGFPAISNSQGKTFIFEIESKSGTDDNSVALDTSYPAFVSRHQFPLSQLIANKNQLINFTYHKLLNLTTDKEFLTHSTAYLLPFFFYLIFLLFNKSYQVPALAVFFVVIFNIFCLDKSHDLYLIFTIIAWTIIILRYRLENRVSISLSALLFIIAPFLLIVKKDIWAGRAAVWAFLFLTIAVIQRFYETKRKSPKQISLKHFWLNLIKLH